MAANDPTVPTVPTRTPAQIEADLAAARLRLANSTEAFVDQVYPARIKQRQIDKMKQFVGNEVDAAKALVYDAQGELRRDRILIAAAAVVGGLVFVAIMRSLTRDRG